MLIRHYENPQIFLAIYEELLLEREAAGQLILFNAYQKLMIPVSPSCIFGAVLKEEEPILLFCNVFPYNLVIYMVKEAGVEEAIDRLTRYILKEDITINGINGRQLLCQRFIEEYNKWNGITFVEKLAMDIMEVRELQELELAKGYQRRGNEEDVIMITDWVLQYKMETMTSELNYEEVLNRVTRWINQEKIVLYVDENHTPVSMAVIIRKLIHGLGIGYAYTPEEYRGNAYAVSNIYHLCKEYLHDEVEFCSLFVDQKNPVSHRSYEKIGFQLVEDHYEYALLKVDDTTKI